MAKLKKFTIEPMDKENDRLEVASWEHIYSDTPGFQQIKHFIMEDNTYHGLNEVIWNNLELVPIGDDELKYSYVAKINDGTIIAWILLDEFDINTTEPELFIQYVCIHPLYQQQGYGEAILKEILFNAKNYVAAQPSNTFAYIHKENIASQNLFKKFNFSLGPLLQNTHYFKAQTKEPMLVSPQESSEVIK